MAEAWERRDIEDAPELLVLLALADFANDDGWCWPSMVALGQKARMSDRQARTYVRRLEARGLVQCPSTKGGKGRSNKYRVCLGVDTRKPASEFGQPEEAQSKAETRNSASDYEADSRKPASEFKGGNPEVGFRDERRKGGSTASQRRKPTSEEPSEPSRKKSASALSGVRATTPDDFSADVSRQVAAEFINHRRNVKAPLNPAAMRLLNSELERIRDAGISPDRALELAMFKGWRGLKLDWVRRELPRDGPQPIPENIRKLQQEHRARQAERKARQ